MNTPTRSSPAAPHHHKSALFPKAPRRGCLGRCVVALHALFALAATAVHAAEPLTDLSFEKSMDMLMAEMKLRVLQSLFESGHYVPPWWVQNLEAEYYELAEELKVAADGDFERMDTWQRETVKLAKAENLEMQRLAQKCATKLLKTVKAPLENLRAWELQVNQWNRDKSTSAYHMAQSVVLLIHRHNRADLGDRYTKAVSDLYRGALGDGVALADRIQNLHRERMAIETSLQYCRFVDRTLKKVGDLEKSPASLLYADAEQALLAHLKATYTGIDKETEANLKWSLGKVKDLSVQAWNTWDKVRALENDRSLAANPTAQRAAKQFAVLGALYGATLGFAKDFKVLEAFGPVADFLDFYGQAISLVPTVAQRMQSTVAKMDQDYLGLRALSTWGNMPETFAPYWDTSLRKAVGGRIDIATGRDLMETADDPPFFLIVPKTPAHPDGYVMLNKSDYQTLCDVVATERALFAQEEALARVDQDLRWKFVFGNPLTAASSESDKELKVALANKARETPLTTDQVLDLLFGGEPVSLHGSEWSRDDAREYRDGFLEQEAEMLAIVTALGEYRFEYLQLWWDFCELLAKYNLPLAPQQILRLFAHYQTNGAAPMLAFFERQAEQREARRLGVPEIGIHDLAVVGDELPRDQSATIEVRSMMSGLAPDREVDAELVWSFSPTWAAGQDARMNVKLRNGVNAFRRDLRVPKDIPAEPLVLRATLTIPPGPGHREPMVVTCEERVRVATVSPLELRCEPAKLPASGGEVRVRATFRVKGLESDETVKLRHQIAVPDVAAAAPEQELECVNGEHTIERIVTVAASAAGRELKTAAQLLTPWAETVRGEGVLAVEAGASAPSAGASGCSVRLFTTKRQGTGNGTQPTTKFLATETVQFFADLNLVPLVGALAGKEIEYEFEITAGGKRVVRSDQIPGLLHVVGEEGYAVAETLPSYPEDYPFEFPKSPKSGTFDWSRYSLANPRFVPFLRGGARNFEARLTMYVQDGQARRTVLAESKAAFEVDYRKFVLKAVRPVAGNEAMLRHAGPGVAVTEFELSGTTARVRLVERDANLAEVASLDAVLELRKWIDQGDGQNGDPPIRYQVKLTGQPSSYDARGQTAYSGISRGLGQSNPANLTPSSPEKSGRFDVSCYTNRKTNSIENPTFTVGLRLTGRQFLFDVVYEDDGG